MTSLKEHLISAGITFTATFFTVIGFTLSQPNFTFSKEALVATIVAGLIAAVRSLAKVIYEVSSSIVVEKNK